MAIGLSCCITPNRGSISSRNDVVLIRDVDLGLGSIRIKLRELCLMAPPGWEGMVINRSISGYGVSIIQPDGLF